MNNIDVNYGLRIFNAEGAEHNFERFALGWRHLFNAEGAEYTCLPAGRRRERREPDILKKVI